MLNLPVGARIFVAREPADMRKAFDGLSGLVINAMDEDPRSGHCFVFFNRRSDRVKILFWERNGYWLHYKRLEKGRFSIFDQASDSEGRFQLDAADLALILEGIDLREASRGERFQLSKEVENA
ncbi:MAG: IS66 family insertion sequence element accessory protein TnpB [Planctomycetota bacterium]